MVVICYNQWCGDGMKRVETEEEVKTKGKMYAMTTSSVIVVIVGLVVCFILCVKSFVSGISKNNYYVLELDDKNRIEIISMLENEEYDYCKLIYKIDYYKTFSNGYEMHIYCKEEKDIVRSIKNFDTSKLVDYIILNGKREIG